MKCSTQFSLIFRREDNKLAESEKCGFPANKTLAVLSKAEQAVADSHLDKGAPASLQQHCGELEKLIGLTRVKELVRELRAYVEICRRRQSFHLKNDNLVLHMVFKGNPGTGKTTVARILGKMLAEMQVLPQGHLIEVERADLVGEFIGHTAQKTREQLKKAVGGILFIDEAYSLARGGGKDFGKEAIDTMVKAMEDNKNQLIIILAGYEKEMEKFLRTNPGLRSRFPIHLDFPDYTCAELLEIALLMVQERQYQLNTGAVDYLRRYLQAQIDHNTANFSNARLVRNLVERAIRRQALRLVERRIYGRDELMQIIREDLLPQEKDECSCTIAK